ncbi:universal stress protein [Acerihabitans sp. KWT182]|uniref:Universal stress protein n=1 Tax=Acerihabitans sp. KWT182 TaxID=3157919 RepID=A0AAU7QEA0_9GAMM
MSIYKHALVLAYDEADGRLLLSHASRLAKAYGTKITVAHIGFDWRWLDYTSDTLTKNRQAREVIEAKAMFSRLIESADCPVAAREIVTMYRFREVERLIKKEGIDLLMVGHRNRFMGVLSSFSFEFINHLSIDVLVKHIDSASAAQRAGE